MASSLALKRLLASNLLPKSLIPLRPAAATSASRLFNTNAGPDHDYSEDDHDLYNLPNNYPNESSANCFHVVDPFSPTRSLSQLLNMEEDRFSNAQRGRFRRGMNVKETDEALCLKVDMPGLGKKHVKVSVDKNILFMEGQGPKEIDEESWRSYASSFILPSEGMYKTGEIKAEMKHGVLKVTVPKVKEEDRRTHVFHVNID